jgi:hypothetical protein
VLNVYEGADQSRHELGTVFSHDESRVYSCDEVAGVVRCWDARSRVRFAAADINCGALPWCVAHSPTAPILVTGGADKLVKFWHIPEAELANEEGRGGVVGAGAGVADDDAAADDGGGGEGAGAGAQSEADLAAACAQFLETTASAVAKATPEEA